MLTPCTSGSDNDYLLTLKEEARFMNRQVGAGAEPELIVMQGMTIYRADPQNERDLQRAVRKIRGA